MTTKVNERQVSFKVVTCIFLILLLTVSVYGSWVRPLEMPQVEVLPENSVSFDMVKDIALAKATQLWGYSTMGEAIPLCDPSGQLTAYEFPFAIGQSQFPDWDVLLNNIQQGLNWLDSLNDPFLSHIEDELPVNGGFIPSNAIGFSHSKDIQPSQRQQLLEQATAARWGIGDYGMIVVSATTKEYPIPRYRDCLPYYFTTGFLAREVAESRLQGTVTLSRIYYAGPMGEWFEFEDSAGETALVHAGTLQVWTTDKFQSTFLKKGILPTGSTYSEELKELGQVWQQIITVGPTAATSHRVSYYQVIEPYLWTFGCAPTSAAMVLSYYDHYVDPIGKFVNWGRLIEYYVTVRDPNHPTHVNNIPTILEGLKIAMSTDASGGTYYPDIHLGIEAVTASYGYNFSSTQNQCTLLCWPFDYLWGSVTAEINANRPFVWSVGYTSRDWVGHSLCAYGYTDDKYVITYNTWDTAEDWWYYKQYDNQFAAELIQIDTAVPDNGNPGQDVLLNDNLSGGSGTANDTYDVWFHQWGTDIKKVKVYYFKESEYSSVWGPQLHYVGSTTTGSAGWHVCPWTLPNVSSTTRYRVVVVGLNSSNSALARDGTPGTFTVNPEPDPVLCRSPSSLNFGTSSTSKTFEVWNCGGGTLSYTISDNKAWITVNPTSGSSTGEHDTITVTVNRSGLSPGHYTGTVTINPNYGSNQNVNVSMDVPAPDPVLCRSPSSLDFGTSSTSKTFEVWNCGGGTLSYSISDNQAWISVSPTSGSSTGEHDNITVTVNRSGLSPGHYTGTVTIDPNYGANQSVSVSMDVPETDPALCRSPSSLDFGTSSTSKTFEVWNCGGGTLSYTISDNKAWISVNPTSGSSTGEHDTITVTVNRSGLSPGHYTGTVTINPNYGSNQNVNVSMDVPAPNPVLCKDKSSLDFGTTSTSKTFEVWNCGGGTLSYTISDNKAWISVNPTSGSSTGEHDTITVTVNRSGLSPGHYTGTVTMNPNYGSNQSVSVSMDVLDGECCPEFQRTIVPKCVTQAAGATVRVIVEIALDRDYSGLALDEDLVGLSGDWSPWQVTPVSNDGATFNANDVQWLWISVNAGDTKRVEYDVTVPAGQPLGTYTWYGAVKSTSPNLDCEVCGDKEIEVKQQCGYSIDYVVAHWVNGAVNPNDPCEISLDQILQAIAWWADGTPVPETNGQTIDLDKILDLIAKWAAGTCVESTTAAGIISGFSTTIGVADVEAVRSLFSTQVAPGESIDVTVTLTASHTFVGLALDEDWPEGWEVTPVENNNAAFNPQELQWLWLTVAEGETKMIRYRVTLPSDSPLGGLYSVTGLVRSASPQFAADVLGDVEVKVAQTNELEIIAYPNPVEDVHTVTFAVKGQEVESISVKVFDLAGRVVFSTGIVPGNSLEWHLRGNDGELLANGIYLFIVEIRASNGTLIKSEARKLAILL